MWKLWKSNHSMKPLGLVQSRIDFRGMYPRGNYLIFSLIIECECKLLLYEPFEVTFRINSEKMNTSDVINLMYDGSMCSIRN